MHRLTQVLVEYFKELEEESIRDNFVIIYELMDEMMDFGYPQTTESKILQECVYTGSSFRLDTDADNRYITQESHKLEIQVRPPMAVTNAVSWRTEGIRYRKNEVFLDVIESVNLLVCTLYFMQDTSPDVISLAILSYCTTPFKRRLTPMEMSYDPKFWAR